MSSTRVLSFSEVSRFLDCQARWDFSYGDQLAGSSLKEKAVAPLLSGGRAWGAAIAAYHVHAGQVDAGELAIAAMDESLQADAERQREFGVHDQSEHDELRTRLLAILVHQIEANEPIVMDAMTERELLVPIPSRTGRRSSSKYKLLCYIDATETMSDGSVWLDEFKLRGSLYPAKLIVMSRQIRWYAWAYQQATGQKVTGVWMNERLNEAPKPPRVLASGKLSHAKDQLTTAAAYIAACEEYGEEPVTTTIEELQARKWGQRVPVMFREDELEEAGLELVSAAKQIHAMETRQLFPLRNAKRQNCGWCPYRDVCPSPNNELIDALFERLPPKKDRKVGEDHPPAASQETSLPY